MRFFALATAALLTITGVFANPTISQSNELEARAEDVALDARTFFGCSILEKLKCKKLKGYSWDSHACCCNKVECPYEAKHECESRHGYWTYKSHPDCSCVCASHGPSDCEKQGKAFDHSKCECKEKPVDPCKDKRSECSKHGWGCNDRCQCTPPSHEPCKNWLKALICYKLGKKCDSNCKCW